MLDFAIWFNELPSGCGLRWLPGKNQNTKYEFKVVQIHLSLIQVTNYFLEEPFF